MAASYEQYNPPQYGASQYSYNGQDAGTHDGDEPQYGNYGYENQDQDYYEHEHHDNSQYQNEEALGDGEQWDAPYPPDPNEQYGHNEQQGFEGDIQNQQHQQGAHEQYPNDHQPAYDDYYDDPEDDYYDPDEEMNGQDWMGHGEEEDSGEPDELLPEHYEDDFLPQPEAPEEHYEETWHPEDEENHTATQHPITQAHPPPPAAPHREPAAQEQHPPADQPQAHHSPASQHSPMPDNVSRSTPGGPTLNIALENTFPDGEMYAVVSGKALDHNESLFLLSSDGKTPIYPTAEGPIHEDISIVIRQGQPTTITIPHIAGGRIYFSRNKKLEFTLNPGPALVEPSVTNESDPNYLTEWGFVELTFNKDQLYANISYVDFVGSIPTGLTLETASGATQHVSGMAPDGLEAVCQGLMQQGQQDGKGWDQLIVQPQGKPLRVLSLNQAVKMKPEAFANYYDQYIDQVWQHLSTSEVTFDTQMAAGVVKARVQGGKLCVGKSQFAKPTTIDVLSCDSGAFATGADPEVNAIIPRVAAAFNRSTLMDTQSFPEDKALHYKHEVTNHYSRVVHEHNADGKGYAFPYDDVQKTGGPDQSGEVHASDPTLLIVTVGGAKAGGQH